MRKTPESIKSKRSQKIREMNAKKNWETWEKIKKAREKADQEVEKIIARIQRKADAYKRKKELFYNRKCDAEIRQLLGKPPKQYKQKQLTHNQKLQLALSIAQENAKLRDTDKDGRGRCISCDKLKPRTELAWGHKESRTIQRICLDEININAQCHDCNYAMGPKGNTNERERLEMKYEENLIARYWREAVEELIGRKRMALINPKKYKLSSSFLDEMILDLIEKNETLRSAKTFHTPGKNWRKLYEKYILPFKQD